VFGLATPLGCGPPAGTTLACMKSRLRKQFRSIMSSNAARVSEGIDCAAAVDPTTGRYSQGSALHAITNR
jgi:hypothetical protein